MMKKVLLKEYNECMDEEQIITIGECDNSMDFCKILCNHFIKHYTTSDGIYHRKIFIDDIEIISYNEYCYIIEYILECHVTGNKFNISCVYLAEQFLVTFGQNRLFQKRVIF